MKDFTYLISSSYSHLNNQINLIKFIIVSVMSNNQISTVNRNIVSTVFFVCIFNLFSNWSLHYIVYICVCAFVYIMTNITWYCV